MEIRKGGDVNWTISLAVVFDNVCFNRAMPRKI